MKSKKFEFDTVRKKNANAAKAHGLPKAHKNFSNIPKIRSVIDTNGTAHCLVSKYMANLLCPFRSN